MTRANVKLDQIELSTTITQSDDQLHEAQPLCVPTLAGEEDPFFDVEPSVIIGVTCAYPVQSAEQRRSIKRSRR